MGNRSSSSENDESITPLNVDECLEFMMKGTRMIKVHILDGKQKVLKKTVILDEDEAGFRYFPTAKGIDYKIPISSIRNLQYGESLEKKIVLSHKKNHQFVVEHEDSNGDTRLTVFVAYSAQSASIWFTGLKHLLEEAGGEKIEPLKDAWLMDAFRKIDVDNNGALDLKEVFDLLNYLNIKPDENAVKEKFKQVNTVGQITTNSAKLNKAEFAKLFEMFDNSEVKYLFEEYSEGQPVWSVESFKKFTSTEQCVNMDTKSITEMINKFEPSNSLREKNQFSHKGLLSFLLSADNDLLKPQHACVHQDMSQPLSHYFINSSHNTYLMEGQLRGSSSVDAYINAFKQGCRCVELDCWDGKDNEPVIFHGHTLTSKILFKDVVEVINEYAFIASEYPVILSIENHCSCEQQIVMATHLKNILKDKLLSIPVDEELGKLPSPESLKGKILIKGKKLSKEDEEMGDGADVPFGYVLDDENEAKEAMEEILTDDELREKYGVSNEEFSIRNIDGNGDSQIGEDEGTEERIDSKSSTKKKTGSNLKLAAALSCLVNYIQSVSFPGFEKALQSQRFYQMSSFGESKFTKLAKSSPADFCLYNQKFLSRTYPAGRRVDSSNYNPITAWAVGCQIVALNYQTNGVMMDLLRAMFQMNGGCGYVLKPPVLLDEHSLLNTEKVEERMSMQVKIMSGHLLRRPNRDRDSDVIDPYVAINVFSLEKDGTPTKFRTKVVRDNGFNPSFDDTLTFGFDANDLVFLRFAVYDDSTLKKDELLLHYTIPLSAVRPGYRRVKLLTANGEEVPYATLLIYTKMHT